MKRAIDKKYDDLKSANSIIAYEAPTGDLLATKAIKVEDIALFVSKRLNKPADINATVTMLRAAGAELVEQAGVKGPLWCPTGWFDLLIESDPEWYAPKPANEDLGARIAVLESKLDKIMEVLSEIYVPIVQKRLLEKITSERTA